MYVCFVYPIVALPFKYWWLIDTLGNILGPASQCLCMLSLYAGWYNSVSNI